MNPCSDIPEEGNAIEITQTANYAPPRQSFVCFGNVSTEDLSTITADQRDIKIQSAQINTNCDSESVDEQYRDKSSKLENLESMTKHDKRYRLTTDNEGLLEQKEVTVKCISENNDIETKEEPIIYEESNNYAHVFKRLRDANVRLKPSKCYFVQRKVDYLGHVVSAEGLSPNPNKIQAVRDFPVPKNNTGIRAFLGLWNYYRRFIKDFAQIASPLNRLTSKNMKFVWTENCQKAFDTLQCALVSAPVLSYPDFSLPFQLYVHASQTGIGLTLGQIVDGKEVVIAYAGRDFNQAERNYSATEREALAVIDGIKRFQSYLYGRRFYIHTDHSALKWLMSIQDPTGHLARWSLLIQQFDFEIIHRPGKSNGNADALTGDLMKDGTFCPRCALASYLSIGIYWGVAVLLASMGGDLDSQMDVSEHRCRIVKNIELLQQIALENIARAQQKMKEYYDRSSQEPNFLEGDKVWVFTPQRKRGLSKKLLHNYHGPYRVVERLSPVHYHLRTCSNTPVTSIVHANRMKIYVDPHDRPITPPREDVDEPYLTESDLPRDSFTPEQTDTVTNTPSTENTPSSHENTSDTLIDNETIFNAEKLLDSRNHTQMAHTAKALDDGFSVLINPMVDIEHHGSYIEASVLLTLPEIPNGKAFCTVENLTPIKFNSSNVCYTGPITRENLVLLTCPHSTQILTTEALSKCYQDLSTFICPTNLLNVATNISWLGFPFNLDSKLTFPRNHVQARDCTNLHPMLNLGGRIFLATMTTTLQLRSGTLVTAPLAVYHFPCNESFDGMITGLGRCPEHMTVSVPLASAANIHFVPWASLTANTTMEYFNHVTLSVPTPVALNQSILDSLDATFTALDGQLTQSLQSTSADIADIQEASISLTADYVAYSALSVGLLNLILNFVSFYFHSRKHGNSSRCNTCRRPLLTLPIQNAEQGGQQDDHDVGESPH
ncbi:hypothetical protein ACROYT_G015976 [Oculina patagonica]